MTFVTDSITYNVCRRGRKVRGQDRVFDTASLARLINGPSVQEKVRHGDMLGYFGHWPRLKFGMETQEGGIDPATGKAINLPLAIRTVELSAEPDGTITHKAEFLDTEAGKVAKGLYDSKAGGFSSAIVPVNGTFPMVAKGFHGFDYVYEPNYDDNRGYKVVLDSIGSDLTSILDGILTQAAQEQGEMHMLFDSLQAQHAMAITALETTARENDWLIARLASKTGFNRDQIMDAILDDADGVGRMRNTCALPDYDRYKNVALTPLSRLSEKKERPTSEDLYMERRFGRAI